MLATPPRGHIRRNSMRRYFQGLQLREYNLQESSSLDNKYDIRRKFRHHIADLSHSLCKTHNITTLCNGLFETLFKGKTKLRNFLPEKLTDRWEGNFQLLFKSARTSCTSSCLYHIRAKKTSPLVYWQISLINLQRNHCQTHYGFLFRLDQNRPDYQVTSGSLRPLHSVPFFESISYFSFHLADLSRPNWFCF